MTNPDGRIDTVSNHNNILASGIGAAMSGGAPSMFMGQKRKRTTQGRKKIEIKKIDNVSNRQVTFSKRRAGLFKKASEICILTGAEATIIVQSSGKRFYSFGHPTVDGVINRYLSKDENNNAATATAAAAANTISPAEMREFNAEYDRLSKELEAEKKKMEAQEKVAAMNNSNGTNFWWEEEIGNMSLEQLEQHEAALEELRKNVLTKADELALVRNSHHHQQHHHAMMNNVDLNRTVIGAAGALGSYDNFNNHANKFDLHRSSSSSAIVPYASDHSFYGNNNNQV